MEQVNVVILAAGMGTRLGKPYPKPLTTLADGRSIMAQQFDNIFAAFGDRARVTVVVGFKHELVMEHVPDAVFVYNENYDVTNTNRSLLKALRSSPIGPVIWMNGDVVFEPEVLHRLADCFATDESAIAVNCASVAEEEVKYTVDEHGFVRLLSKQVPVAQALGEAVGDRDLPRALRVLDEELWTIRAGVDKRKSEIGLVYGLISKIRLLLLMKELRRLGIVRPARDIHAFRNQIAGIAPGTLPADKKYNPLAGQPYPAFLALRQCEQWEGAELVRALDTLLDANLRLVTSGLDEAVVLQRALVELIGTGRTTPKSPRPA